MQHKAANGPCNKKHGLGSSGQGKKSAPDKGSPPRTTTTWTLNTMWNWQLPTVQPVTWQPCRQPPLPRLPSFSPNFPSLHCCHIPTQLPSFHCCHIPCVPSSLPNGRKQTTKPLLLTFKRRASGNTSIIFFSSRRWWWWVCVFFCGTAA
jgi:hypothetical protein